MLKISFILKTIYLGSVTEKQKRRGEEMKPEKKAPFILTHTYTQTDRDKRRESEREPSLASL